MQIDVGDVVTVARSAPDVHVIAGGGYPEGELAVIAVKPAKGRRQLEVRSSEGRAWSVPDHACTLVRSGERRVHEISDDRASLKDEARAERAADRAARRESTMSDTTTTLKASSSKRSAAKPAAKASTSKSTAKKSTAKRTTAKPAPKTNGNGNDGKVRVTPRLYKGEIAYKMSKKNADRNAQALAMLKSGKSVAAVSSKLDMSEDYLNRLFKIDAA
jgi:hypothetical protein